MYKGILLIFLFGITVNSFHFHRALFKSGSSLKSCVNNRPGINSSCSECLRHFEYNILRDNYILNLNTSIRALESEKQRLLGILASNEILIASNDVAKALNITDFAVNRERIGLAHYINKHSSWVQKQEKLLAFAAFVPEIDIEVRQPIDTKSKRFLNRLVNKVKSTYGDVPVDTRAFEILFPFSTQYNAFVKLRKKQCF